MPSPPCDMQCMTVPSRHAPPSRLLKSVPLLFMLRPAHFNVVAQLPMSCAWWPEALGVGYFFAYLVMVPRPPRNPPLSCLHFAAVDRHARFAGGFGSGLLLLNAIDNSLPTPQSSIAFVHLSSLAMLWWLSAPFPRLSSCTAL